ncbi:hypothetical protein OXX80_011893 [Metschnikowia pulcherrima]
MLKRRQANENTCSVKIKGQRGQGCSCIDVATMTLAGADDDATMGKAESLIPSCVQQCLVSQLLIVYVCVSGTAHLDLAVEGLASFQVDETAAL